MSVQCNFFLSYEHLQKYLGVSRLTLWSCPCCGPSVRPCHVAASPHYSWGVVLFCGLCNTSWLVCKECPNVRTRFINATETLAHHQRKHSSYNSEVGAKQCGSTGVGGAVGVFRSDTA
jgi:hypothetical protein